MDKFDLIVCGAGVAGFCAAVAAARGLSLAEFFRSLGKSDRVEIQVHETNSAAIHVYQKAGFAETGRAARNKTFIVMKREL